MENGELSSGMTDSIINPEDFTPLIRKAMRDNHVNCAELARRTGINRSKLSRGLNGRSRLDLKKVYTICHCLGIDVKRAILVVTYFGDLSQYNDPDITIVSDLMKVLPATISAAREGCARAPISDAGVLVLANHIGARIADNDRKVTERRHAAEFAEELSPQRKLG